VDAIAKKLPAAGIESNGIGLNPFIGYCEVYYNSLSLGVNIIPYILFALKVGEKLKPGRVQL
jgi:hypothetical protein